MTTQALSKQTGGTTPTKKTRKLSQTDTPCPRLGPWGCQVQSELYHTVHDSQSTPTSHASTLDHCHQESTGKGGAHWDAILKRGQDGWTYSPKTQACCLGEARASANCDPWHAGRHWCWTYTPRRKPVAWGRPATNQLLQPRLPLAKSIGRIPGRTLPSMSGGRTRAAFVFRPGPGRDPPGWSGGRPGGLADTRAELAAYYLGGALRRSALVFRIGSEFGVLGGYPGVTRARPGWTSFAL